MTEARQSAAAVRDAAAAEFNRLATALLVKLEVRDSDTGSRLHDRASALFSWFLGRVRPDDEDLAAGVEGRPS